MGIASTNWGWPWYLAILACLVTGAVIGTFIGILVARLGIPSFVVTLAMFLALQGVLLQLIGEGGTIPIRDSTLLAINNNDMPVWLGWLLYVIVVVGYAIVVAILVVLLVGLTFLLTRTSFGRHVYAVGGNAGAARRAGINVPGIKWICFIIGSTLATTGGIMIASRDNSISPSTGGASTLLYAVGAAVIGGTSLFGGKGRVADAILGGLVIAIIANGLPLI